MKKKKKINKYLTPQEAIQYYKKRPLETLFIIVAIILVILTMLVWDGRIPVSCGLTTFLD
jgi:hypothetical protein